MDFETLEQAKDWLRSRLKDGAACPCCGQMAKVYSRPIHASMAAGLLQFFYYAEGRIDQFHHIENIMKNKRFKLVGDFAKLRYWGFIEERPEKDSKSKARTSGFWKLTEKGRDFVLGKIKVPQKVQLYDGRRLKFEGPEVSFSDCMKEPFSFDEIMKTAGAKESIAGQKSLFA